MQVFPGVLIDIHTDGRFGEEIIVAQLNPLIRSFNRHAGEMKSEGYILQGSVGWGAL
jgi:hypothetical protein